MRKLKTMLSLETRAAIARERYNDYIAQAAHDRAAATVFAQCLPFSRRMARPLGQALLQVSILLLRYARAETPAVLYRAPVHSVELN